MNVIIKIALLKLIFKKIYVHVIIIYVLRSKKILEIKLVANLTLYKL